MPYFKSDGITFHYLDVGQGVPFLFQHGLGGDRVQTYSTFQPPLSFRLLTLECRGHGKTGLGNPNALSFDRYADDLIAFMERIDLQKAIVGGISMGAGVALNFATRYPQYAMALVLVRPAWLDKPLPANLRVYPRIAALIRQAGPVQGCELFKQTEEYLQVLRTYPAAASSLIKQFERPGARESVDILERLPNDAPTRSQESWAGIDVPTLILANDLDPVHPYAFGEVLAHAISGAILARITPKEIDAQQHSLDIQRAFEQFLAGN